MIAAGVARKLIFSWLGNPGVGGLGAIQRRIEPATSGGEGQPPRLEIEEYSHFGMVGRYTAAAESRPRRLRGANTHQRRPDPLDLRHVGHEAGDETRTSARATASYGQPVTARLATRRTLPSVMARCVGEELQLLRGLISRARPGPLPAAGRVCWAPRATLAVRG
jgi:hypothetical protein